MSTHLIRSDQAASPLLDSSVNRYTDAGINLNNITWVFNMGEQLT
jgi:hypothetical protein